MNSAKSPNGSSQQKASQFSFSYQALLNQDSPTMLDDSNPKDKVRLSHSEEGYVGNKPMVEAINPDIVLEGVSYGPQGIRGLFGSPYVSGAALLASMGGFSFEYDQGVISIINVVDQFHDAFPQTVSPFGKSFMTGMLLLGAFVGCIFMPYLADKLSRKWALTVVAVIFNIGAIMQTAAPNYAVLVAGRTIGGVGVGTLAMVCYSPQETRDF